MIMVCATQPASQQQSSDRTVKCYADTGTASVSERGAEREGESITAKPNCVCVVCVAFECV